MTLLKLELRPSALANSFCLWLVLRFLLAAALLLSVVCAPVLVALACFAAYVVVSLFYFFSMHRLVLAVFMLAQKEAEGESP